MSEEKIGMYSIEEIYEELANGFLHHSMVDAMYFKIKDLQQKVEQLENIRKEAIEYVYKHIQEYDVDGTFANLDEFDFIARPQVLLNILNRGDNKYE